MHNSDSEDMPHASQSHDLRVRTGALERLVEEHSRTTASLSEYTERFRVVADYTYDLESWIDPDGRLIWVNPAVERLTGYTVAECMAMPDYPVPLVHKQDLEHVGAAFRGALSGSSGNDLPFRLRRKDGETRWVAVSWQPIYAVDGTCLGHRSSIRDISDRKRAEDALREERRLLNRIIAYIPSGVFWKGRDFRYRGCNAAFARSAGVDRPERIVGKTDYELAWEKEQADYFRACDRRVMEENRALLNIEEEERQADGRQAILLTSKVPLHDEDGHVCGVLGIDTDISEMKQVEAELREIRAELESRVRDRTSELSSANQQLRQEIRERERIEEVLRGSEERYRLVSELTSDFAYAFSVESGGTCRAEWLTDAFSRISGRSPSAVEAGEWNRISHPDDLPILQRRICSLLAGRSVVSEFRIVAGDGRIRWLRDHARPIWSEAENRVVRILGAAQDITDQKHAEEEARRHQSALAQVARLTTLGELAAQLAHELNQPLCTMVGNAQTAQRLLASPTTDMAELRDALNDIVTFGTQAASVIKRLREFLRQQQPQPVILNVQRMIEEIAGFLEADARQHAATVRFDIADDLPAIRGDPIQLQQVLLNLVRNGLEAVSTLRDGPREVLVGAGHHGSESMLLRVSDSGPGLDAEIAERIFDPFATTKSTGLGLGLAICRSIVETHAGRLWAEFGPGRGTTFFVALPAHHEETA